MKRYKHLLEHAADICEKSCPNISYLLHVLPCTAACGTSDGDLCMVINIHPSPSPLLFFPFCSPPAPLLFFPLSSFLLYSSSHSFLQSSLRSPATVAAAAKAVTVEETAEVAALTASSAVAAAVASAINVSTTFTNHQFPGIIKQL